MGKPLRLLIVEDSEDDAQLLLIDLRRGGYEPSYKRVETREGMKAALASQEWDLVISDYVMPTFSGMEALGVLRESRLDLPFILLSGNIGEDIAVDAMKAGANDYIIKGNLARLAPAVDRELRDAEVRRARARAEEERARLAMAVQDVAEAVVITDARGIIQYVNPAFEKITGYSKEEVVGGDMHFLDGGRHDESFFRSLRDSLGRDGVWSGRVTNKKKDGTFYEEEWTISPVKNESGEVVNYVSVKRDITEKLRLESIAQAVDTMNNIGYIFSGVRHEIGNPISSVAMALNVLKMKLDNFDKENIARYIDRALEEIVKVEYLLHSLKNYNMYENPELRTISMKDFTGKLFSLVREDFSRKGIKIDVSVNPESVSAYADPRALQQVLLNVMTNAADALDGRPCPRIALRVFAADSQVGIRVEDNGCGMTEQNLASVFKPFYTSKPRGTGLGLVIVRKMVALMNGSVTITSRAGEGTAVELLLPAGKP